MTCGNSSVQITPDSLGLAQVSLFDLGLSNCSFASGNSNEVGVSVTAGVLTLSSVTAGLSGTVNYQTLCGGVADDCSFTFTTVTAGGGCIALPTQQVSVGSPLTLQPSQINSSGAAPTSFVESVNNVVQINSLNPVTVTGINTGLVTITYTFPNGDECPVSYNVGGVSVGQCQGIAAQSVAVGSTITIQPSQINSSGAAPTSFTESVNNIVQVLSLSPITISGLAAGTTTLTFQFPNGDACPVTINVGGGGGGGCLTLPTQNVSVGGGLTVQPSQLNSSGQAPVSFIESANNIAQVGGLNPISITGLMTGTVTYTFTFPNGDECDLTVEVGGNTSTNPTCAISTINQTAGSSISAAQLASGGTAPYLISNFTSPNNLIISTGSQIVIDSAITPGTYGVSYIILDDNNNPSVTCNLDIVIGATACDDTATISFSPASLSPGGQTTVTVGECNCSGYITRVVNPDGVLTDASGNVVPVNPTNITIPNNGLSQAFNITIPATAPSSTTGTTYRLIAQCCPPE